MCCVPRFHKNALHGPTEQKVHRLVRRLQLQADNAELWLGMLRQILWKVQSGK